MKAILEKAAVAAAISLGVFHIAAAQDRETRANELFEISEQIQRSGPCRGLPFLWLTNEKIIAFLDALAEGEYDNAGPMLPQYVACFEHQASVVDIRTVIHAEFPETEAALKVAEVGYFTEEDIDDFITLLNFAVKTAATGGSKATLTRSGGTRTPQIRPTRRATPGPDKLADRVQRTARAAGAQGRALDEPNSTRIALRKPPSPSSPSEQAVAALLKSLEKEIQEPVAPVSDGEDIALASPQERQSQGDPALRERQTIQVESAMAQRRRRFGELRGRNRFSSNRLKRQRLAFVPFRPDNQRPAPVQPLATSEVASIRRHIQDCWVPPGALRDRQDLAVTIRFGLFPDGSLRTAPAVVEQSRLRSRDFRLAAETAQRAVLECTPLEGLPEASYERWREIALVFDPRDLPGPSTISREGGLLGAGDEIRVTVFGEEDLSGAFKVSANGWISLPLIGGVVAAGRSAEQLELSIVKALLDGHLKNPRVGVEVLTFQPIFVMGEVNNPGSYPYSAGLTVLKTIALAGGFTYRAKKNVLFLTRESEQGEQKVGLNKHVLPGDTIRVKERWF